MSAYELIDEALRRLATVEDLLHRAADRSYLAKKAGRSRGKRSNCPVKFDQTEKIATVEGQKITLKRQELFIVRALVNEYPYAVSARELRCIGNPSMVIRRLEIKYPKLGAVIERPNGKGTGYRLRARLS
jgi:hypothetical protein